MRLEHLEELKSAGEQAVIINVNTKLVTTLALMSALKYAGMPVLVIDCESQDRSVELFLALMERYDFDLLSAPLRNHGLTLDWLFAHIRARNVLLIDSDLEILRPDVVGMMRQRIEGQHVFGSGFVHNGAWMHAHGMPNAYYEERMWIPLTMLKVELVREALQSGYSFLPRNIFNDFPPSELISRLLVKRFRIPMARNLKLSWLNPFKRDFHGIKPSLICYDTGAELYQYLKEQRRYEFGALPWELHERSVTHFHGVTRLLLNARDAHGTQLAGITEQIEQRLRDVYGFSVAEQAPIRPKA